MATIERHLSQPLTNLNNTSTIQKSSIMDFSSSLQSILIFLLCAPLITYLILSIWSDYKLWLSLGQGGVPSSPYGYMKISLLRLVALDKRACLTGPAVLLTEKLGYFGPDDLPLRTGERPQVVGIVPHRQISQRASIQDIHLFRHIMESHTRNQPSLHIARSVQEKHAPAMFCTPNCMAIPKEVAHMHDVDGSMHLTLSLPDAALIIERAWGERHPLSGKTLPAGFIMVYAPRDKKDMEILMTIIEGAAWWAGQGEDVTM